MGARITGAGTSIIEILGVEKMRGVQERIIPDRLEAGTFAIAAALTGGEVMLYDVNVSHMDPLTHKLTEVGVEVEEGEGTYVIRPGTSRQPVEVQTLHYPGFPTDLQAPFAVLLTQADGISLVHERVFNDRLQYCSELGKMGAKIKVKGQTAEITGPTKLTGAQIKALDIRSGAAMVLAGLAAEGETEVSDIHHVNRGYENLDGKLRQLGADIRRVSC
jgi:UDP-N-acetylglucosamine 1-carboxyvinyltransferase